MFSNIYFREGILDEEDPGNWKWETVDFEEGMLQKKNEGL